MAFIFARDWTWNSFEHPLYVCGIMYGHNTLLTHQLKVLLLRAMPTWDGDQDVESLQHIHLLEPPAVDQVVDFALTASIQQHQAVLRPHQQVHSCTNMLLFVIVQMINMIAVLVLRRVSHPRELHRESQSWSASCICGSPACRCAAWCWWGWRWPPRSFGPRWASPPPAAVSAARQQTALQHETQQLINRCLNVLTVTKLPCWFFKLMTWYIIAAVDHNHYDKDLSASNKNNTSTKY